MNSELIYNKYICANCGTMVLANTIEEIIDNKKMCIDCLTHTENISTKDRIKKQYSIKRRPKKETRPKTSFELENKKKEDEAKWGYLRSSKESK